MSGVNTITKMRLRYLQRYLVIVNEVNNQHLKILSLFVGFVFCEAAIRSYQIKPPKILCMKEGRIVTMHVIMLNKRVVTYSKVSQKTDVVGTISVLYVLSSLTEFSHLSSRLKQMAVELAARVSEPQAMNVVAFNKFRC